MCRIEGCEAKALAKGMCAKHYMRECRTGDPNSVGRAGRKRSPQRLQIEEEGPDMPRRTFARFKQAMEMLGESGCDKEEALECIETALRPNGLLNVSKLQGTAFKRYVVRFEGVSQSDAEWV